MLVASVRTSTLFTLNELATFIWESADGQTPVDEIVDRICSQYDVDRETALRDVNELTEKLVSDGLLQPSESAFPKDEDRDFV
jgi:Coenzyme PQQ synthesis protein D (PqqD)